jgi:Domain of unknown function (DUF4396)
MVLATWWGWGDVASIVLAVVLAFFFGYGLTSLPLLRAGMSVREVAPLAFASDTASITTMEIVDNPFILIVPGAISAGAWRASSPRHPLGGGFGAPSLADRQVSRLGQPPRAIFETHFPNAFFFVP